MDDSVGFDFKKEHASVLVKKLQECAYLLDESASYAADNGTEPTATSFKVKIAHIFADLSYDVLEQGFYKKYPELRPVESDLRDENT